MNQSQVQEELIFDNARKISARADREAYLKEACGDDTQLYQRLCKLLDANSIDDSFLERTSNTDVSSPVQDSVGSIIGPYKLLQQIGEGGMGIVYMADQTEPVKRRVALKIIKPGMDTRKVVARFEAERQALALMEHPNIAKVLDAGTTNTGRPYFVMELVKGTPITKYCDDNRLTTGQRLDLFITVCQAVQHAHQKGIIHRDLKPTNIMVAQYDERPVVKVIDFGVAKATSQALTEKTMFTEYGQIIGTIEYMSPEQARVNQLDIDTRSDVYSLGVLLYELLTGETPFDKKRLRSAAFEEMLQIIREEEPPKPSTRLSSSEALPSTAVNRSVEPAKLNATVRGDLDWIVMRALEKDRNRRYESASSFASDIERYLKDEPVEACPPSRGYRLQKFTKRNKVFLTTSAIVMISLVAGTGISVWQAVEASKARHLAETRELRAVTENAKANAVVELMEEMLSSANPTKGNEKNYTVRELLEHFSTDLNSQLKEQPEVEAEVRSTIGKAYGQLGMPEKGEPHLLRALNLRRQIYGDNHEMVAESLLDLAWNLNWKSGEESAEAPARKALAIYRQLPGKTRESIHAMRALFLFFRNQQKEAEADAIARQAETLVITHKIPLEHQGDFASILHTWSRMKYLNGEHEEAIKLAHRSVKLHRKAHGESHPETAYGLSTLAFVLDHADHRQAVGHQREALQIFRKLHQNDEGPGIRWCLSHLSTSMMVHNEYDEAEVLWQDTSALRKKQFGNDHYRTAEALSYLATILKSQGNVLEANRYHQKALAINKNYETLEGISIPLWYNHALICLKDLDMDGYGLTCSVILKSVPVSSNPYALYITTWTCALAPNAIEDYDSVIILARHAVEKSPENKRYLNGLGAILMRAGQYDAAKIELDKALAAGETDNTSSSYTRYFLAMTEHHLGHKQAAMNQLQTANDGATKELDDSPVWNRKLTLELLRKEAEALIGSIDH